MYSSFKKIINMKEIKKTYSIWEPRKIFAKRLNQGKTASINCSRYIISPTNELQVYTNKVTINIIRYLDPFGEAPISTM